MSIRLQPLLPQRTSLRESGFIVSHHQGHPHCPTWGWGRIGTRASIARSGAGGSCHLGGKLVPRPSLRWRQPLHLLPRYRLCLSLLVLFLVVPRACPWGVEVGITPGRHDRPRHTLQAGDVPLHKNNHVEEDNLSCFK